MKECNTCENNKFSLPTMVCNDCGTGFKHYIPITDEAESEVRVDAVVRQKILKVLQEWGKPTGMFDGMWKGYERLADDTGIYDIKLLKKEMKILHKENKVELKPTYNDDGIINGRGWFIFSA